jgi:hypothetical protein
MMKIMILMVYITISHTYILSPITKTRIFNLCMSTDDDGPKLQMKEDNDGPTISAKSYDEIKKGRSDKCNFMVTYRLLRYVNVYLYMYIHKYIHI